MKAELRLAAHLVRPGEQVIEVWYGGEFIATIAAWDGPGVKVISKYRLTAHLGDATDTAVPISISTTLGGVTVEVSGIDA
jgi:hypothetical protein